MKDQHGHPEAEDIELGELLQALADPLRRQVIRELVLLPEGSERTCASFNLPVSKATLTHHFKILRHSGLIRQVDRGNSRAAQLRRSDIEQRFPGLLALLASEASALFTETAPDICNETKNP
ncbi:ArsR/SmtB family transcription factor [Tatumella citrea]|uniref:ArsR family transcriptional regulator n=1 Tax=Tatumella citrea TaxID=53336 RepID=A0A1Y0L938_TATCI|nr:helix-turn-helix domain-containing protein [Tatumella citrea]ARU94544.1 ArsR family transcriptional regulator [Tatumella citrea]ARU98582.1 ArsR family transcriptional regulator [Tatumella citrea]